MSTNINFNTYNTSVAHSAQAPLRLWTARPISRALVSLLGESGEINEIITVDLLFLRDRRSRLVYGACSSSLRAKGILRYSQMKKHGLAGVGVGC